MNFKRYLPSREFPPYAFIPGKHTHPEKPGGHMENIEVSTQKLDQNNYFSNEEYLYGIDLFNYHYYWESHVWWESLWNVAGRKGDDADFLKGLIKLAAAGVKINLKQDEAAAGHIKRALEILSPLSKDQNNWFGIELNSLISQLDALVIGSEVEDFFKLKLFIN